ncbi:unnamed protein product, partial [marine sediment metagenome]
MFHCSATEGQKFQIEATRISELIKNCPYNAITMNDDGAEVNEILC